MLGVIISDAFDSISLGAVSVEKGREEFFTDWHSGVQGKYTNAKGVSWDQNCFEVRNILFSFDAAQQWFPNEKYL